MNQIIATLVLSISFFCGYYLASVKAERDMLAEQKAQAVKILKIEQENEKKLQRAEERVSEAITERDSKLDALRAANNDLSKRLDRMRKSAADASASRASKGSSSEDFNEEPIEECKRLLIESAELLREGTEILGQNSVTHDALAKSVKNSVKIK